MSLLTKLNSLATVVEKDVKKADELIYGEVYTIVSIKIVKGGFAEIPLVELEDFKVFLPQRLTEVVRENLMELNSGKKFGLIYLGQKKFQGAKYKATPLFEFKEL